MADTDEHEFEELFGEQNAEESPAASVDEDDADTFFQEIDGEEVEDTTSAHNATVHVAGRVYAVGLFWQSSDDPKRVAKEAIAYSKSESVGADLYCVRVGEAVQFGLGQKERGHRPGMPSLAASIDEAMTGDWLAAFYIGGFYYVSAVRKGLILSERDQIFVVEADAKEVFMELYYGADWDDVICPDAWDMSEDDVREEHIESVIHGITAGKLKSTNPVAGLLKKGIFLALIAGIGFGGYTYYNYHLEQERLERVAAAREAARLAAENVDKKSLSQRAQEEMEKALSAVEDTVAPLLGIERQQNIERPDVPPPAPWKGRKNGTGMLIACVQDIMKAPMDVPGWETTQVNCSDRNIQVSLQRAGGTALWAEKHLKVNGYPDVNFRRNAGANSLFVTYPPSYVSLYGENLAPQPVDAVINYLREHFVEMGMQIEAVMQPDDPRNHRSRFFREGTISFSTNVNPTEFSSIFSKVKGLIIDSVTLNVKSNQWSVRGSIFDRRERPLPRPEPESDQN